jgi:hypothetical protein
LKKLLHTNHKVHTKQEGIVGLQVTGLKEIEKIVPINVENIFSMVSNMPYIRL